MQLKNIQTEDIPRALDIIAQAKKHLKEQGIDQWQTAYPDVTDIEKDVVRQTGYFAVENAEIVGYLCVDFGGEPAYDTLDGAWSREGNYVVVHRMAFDGAARGKGFSSAVFQCVEALSVQKGVRYFRIDTDAANQKMQHVLRKNGFAYCGIIQYDHAERIAFDKRF